MGLLDDLRKQADVLKTEAEEEQERQQRLRNVYLAEINPKLIQIYRYLKEVVDHLNYINPDVLISYQLPVCGQIAGFRQTDYRIAADSSEEMHEIHFQFTCQREKRLHLRLENSHEIEKLSDYLAERRIQFHCKKEKDDNFLVTAAYFSISNRIPVLFKITANVEDSTIEFSISNFNELGGRKITLVGSQINDDLLDSLGRYILREEDSFPPLNISEEEVGAIRQKVMQEKKRLQEELRLAEEREREERSKMTKEKRLLKLFKTRIEK